MKIAVLNNLYRPYNRGGAEQVAESLVASLKQKGNKVFVISSRPRTAKEMQIDNVYYIKSLFYSLNKVPYYARFIWHVWDQLNIINAVKIIKILNKENPQLVICNNLKGLGMLSPIIFKLKKIKYVQILHDIQLLHPSGLMVFGEEKKLDKIESKIYQFINKAIYNKIDLLVSPSKWLLDLHQSRGFFKDIKCAVLANPIHQSKEQAIRRINKIVNFIYIGQLEKHKGLEVLLESFSELAKNKELKLAIVGSGSLEYKIAKYAEKYSYIQYFGQKTHAEAMQLLSQADCLVIPSICYENAPMVIFESFILGIPVVGSRLGGIEELLANGKGVLFSPNNQEDLINKLQWAIKNPDKLELIRTKNLESLTKNYASNYSKKIMNLI